jgi:membrane protease YdiL (CAAX protease family)
MSYDDLNPSGSAPVRARSDEPRDSASEEVPPPALESPEPIPQNPPGFPPPPQFRAGVSDDLRVPWGWLEVALFAILGIIAGVVVTWGMAQAAVRFFGVNPKDLFGTTMSTAKSVVVLISQAVLDVGAILYLYVMLLTRTRQPFWPTIGWREMRPGAGKIRDSAVQFLAAGAVLAVAVSFIGSFLNPKETLPIEELLKARVSMLLFGVLGVLVAPLVEETIFRGFLYPVIARRLGITAGIAITGTLFGLMHAAQLWGGWGQIALLILVGVVLTWARARTGTVAASYLMHLGYNGLQLAGYLIYVVSGGHR